MSMWTMQDHFRASHYVDAHSKWIEVHIVHFIGKLQAGSFVLALKCMCWRHRFVHTWYISFTMHIALQKVIMVLLMNILTRTMNT